MGRLNLKRGRKSVGVCVLALEPRRLCSGSHLVGAPAGAPASSPPPVVAEAYAGGATWSAAFKQNLYDTGRGSELYGAILSDGLVFGFPWINTNQITLRFNADVVVDADDLAVRGVTVRNYAISSLQVSGEFYTVATWTLARPLANDSVVVELNCDAPDGVQSHGFFVDGDFDGLPGGDYRQRLYSLPGDTGPDGRVNAIDLSGVRQGYGRSPGERNYSTWYDLDGSGRINALDLAAVRQRLGTKVPAGTPAGTAFATSASTTSVLASSPAKQLFGSTPVLP